MLFKKSFYFVVLLLASSQAVAGYWDCDVEVRSQRPGMIYFAETVTREISADKRSTAESKAVNEGFSFNKRGLLGSKIIYVCAQGNEEESGKACYYGITSASCRSQ